jgi:hypothetical protein
MAFESTKVIITAKDDTQQAFNSVVAGLGKIKNIAGGLGLAFGLNEALDFAKAVTRSTIEAEQASAKITATLKATGFSAGVTKAELDELAESLARSTQFDDDGIRNAEAAFLKFGNIQEGVFQRGITLATDLAALMGTDIESAAQTIGKALSAPGEGTGALEKQIGKLTKAQQDSIDAFVEQGNLASAQSAILDVLQGKIGGTANEMNTGLTKSTKDLSKAWDDMLEAFGKTEAFRVPVTSTLGFITDAISGVDIDKMVAISNEFNKLNKPQSKPGFEQSGKFNIGSDFPLSMADEGFKAKLGAAEKQRLEKQEAAERKNAEAAEKSRKASEAAAKAEANRALSFVENIKKQAASLDLSRVELLKYDAAQLKLTESQRAVVDGAINQIDAFERNAAALKQLAEDTRVFAEGDDRQLSALEDESAQEQEDLKSRADAYEEFYSRLIAENENLNVSILSSDKERAQAQLALDYQRNIDRINLMMLSADEAEALVEQETSNYQLRIQEIANQSKSGFEDIERALDGFSRNSATVIADFAFGAEQDIGDMVNSILKDLARLALQKSITDPVSDYLTTGFKDIFSGFSIDGFRADGGPVTAGKSYIVGERGPEVFNPSGSGTIIPNEFLGGGGDQYSVSVMVDATGGSVAGSDTKANDLGRQIEAAVRGVLLKEKRQGGILS